MTTNWTQLISQLNDIIGQQPYVTSGEPGERQREAGWMCLSCYVIHQLNSCYWLSVEWLITSGRGRGNENARMATISLHCCGNHIFSHCIIDVGLLRNFVSNQVIVAPCRCTLADNVIVHCCIFYVKRDIFSTRYTSCMQSSCMHTKFCILNTVYICRHMSTWFSIWYP